MRIRRLKLRFRFQGLVVSRISELLDTPVLSSTAMSSSSGSSAGGSSGRAR
mgnify:CR=1 FL=1